MAKNSVSLDLELAFILNLGVIHIPVASVESPLGTFVMNQQGVARNCIPDPSQSPVRPITRQETRPGSRLLNWGFITNKNACSFFKTDRQIPPLLFFNRHLTPEKIECRVRTT